MGIFLHSLLKEPRAKCDRGDICITQQSVSAALTWSRAGTSAPFVVTKGPLEVKFTQPACNCFKTR